MKKTIAKKKSVETKPKETRLEDYAVPAFLVDHVELDVDIGVKKTRVASRLNIRRNLAAKDKKAPLVLDGEEQELLRVAVNGVELSAQSYTLTEKTLTIAYVPDEAIVEIESLNEPAKNTALSGFYKAGDILCTQCESEGFRRITYYPDRPDVMANFRVTLHADKKKYPTLLANGNLIKKGSEKGGRHYAVWEDPFRKPCYLFAMVAGKFDKATDHFTTKSGRKVLLEIYVDPGKKKDTGFAMASIKKAMAWDEKTYGLEYDLDRFMIVAVSAFNYAAMENKGLNIFNDAYTLGNPEKTTDSTIAYIERVVGHEYFHNWTGNRITCRDWFQISLKEGLTVFREQEFCGDMTSPSLERITTVGTLLRGSQFSEDAGAMAHPVRPHSYLNIDNFYTRTVYKKGSEVVRMIQAMVGKKGFRKGMNLYVKRHDGTAATCEDFVQAMAGANSLDLDHFMLWYEQAGTPVLDVTSDYDAKKKEFTLRVKQHTPPTPGQKDKKPLHMPLCVGLLDEKGKDMKGTFVLDLQTKEEIFVFLNVESKPVPSLLRGFSAPVWLNYPYTDDELMLLMAHDTDSFVRWDAGQQLFAKYIMSGEAVPESFIKALRRVLKDKRMDAATKAATLTAPSEAELGLKLVKQGKKIDPIKLYEMRQRVVRAVAEGLADDLWATYETLSETLSERASDGVARGQRSLKHLCLFYLSKTVPEDVIPVAAALVASSRNMTDKTVGLDLLAQLNAKVKDKLFARFAKDYGKEPTIMDHWLSAQAGARRPGVLKDVKKLLTHKAFDIKNPNRVSSLVGVFAGNPFGLHAADGSGYAFVADMAIKLDTINPHMSARMASAFLRWRDIEPKRGKMMKAQLERMAALKKCTPNLREIVGKALGKK